MGLRVKSTQVEQSKNNAHRPIQWKARLSIALLLSTMTLLPISAPLGLTFNTDRFSTSSFRDEDTKTAEEMAAYPEAARRAALIVAGYPEELLEIQKIQQKSSDDFAALLDAFPRSTQDQIWNLVRYGDLAKELGGGGRKSKSQLEVIAEKFPAEDRKAIIEEGLDRYSLWVEIYALDLEVEQRFFSLLSPLPETTQNAFASLTEHPGLASLLIDNMHMTTILGAAYREDPAEVESRFNALHEEVLARQDEEERAWAEEVADPEAAQELEYAARAFAEKYEYDYAQEEIAGTTTTTITRTVYVDRYVSVNPYPFWFGYPYWYDVAYWYPRPVWGHVGFYYGFGNGYVSVGLPSPLFLGWYHGYYAPRHWNGYYDHHQHTTYHHVNYYEEHRPHYSEGHRRHHDSRVKRGHNDPRRHHESGTRVAAYSHHDNYSRTDDALRYSNKDRHTSTDRYQKKPRGQGRDAGLANDGVDRRQRDSSRARANIDSRSRSTDRHQRKFGARHERSRPNGISTSAKRLAASRERQTGPSLRRRNETRSPNASRDPRIKRSDGLTLKQPRKDRSQRDIARDNRGQDRQRSRMASSSRQGSRVQSNKDARIVRTPKIAPKKSTARRTETRIARAHIEKRAPKSSVRSSGQRRNSSHQGARAMRKGSSPQKHKVRSHSGPRNGSKSRGRGHRQNTSGNHGRRAS